MYSLPNQSLKKTKQFSEIDKYIKGKLKALRKWVQTLYKSLKSIVTQPFCRIAG
jgi:hypothetical protein